jgi:DUF1680 family protein
MKNLIHFLIILAFMAQLVPKATVSAQEDAKMALRNKVPLKAYPFALEDVRLLDGPFHDAMIRDQNYLLSLDPDRLLHMFRVTAGLPSSAEPLGGWEAPDVELRGHSTGHYLSACALMYASTGDERFKARAVGMVAELAKIQDAMPARGFHSGYLSAFPEEFFDRVDARKQVWAPYYTIHKIMAGLLDVYLMCRDRQALDVVQKMADWVKFRVDRLTEAQQQRALGTEFGGMNEVLANLYAVTGNAEYLRVAHKFDHKALFDPLAHGEDSLDGLHANTQFPKVIGAAREYELTGDRRYEEIADFFWKRVALHRSYVIGGNSDNEAFFPVKDFSKHLGPTTTETCNTYNMLKLTRHIFALTLSAEAMDFYERGLYNQILASQDPATGMMTYYVPLEPGAFKTFSTPNESFWCCVGTGMENHAKYGSSVYFHDSRSLYLNLFIPSELSWKEKGLVVRQETRFPEEDVTRLTMKCERPMRLALRVRYPSWAVSGMELMVNGKEEPVRGKPGSYVSLEREWRDGDMVQIRLPMSLRMEFMPDDSSVVALLYGPVVLAGDLGREGMDAVTQYGPSAPQLGRLKPMEVPAFVCSRESVLEHVKPIPGAPLTFKTDGIGQPHDVTLVPFYRMFHDRYSVYWKVYSAEGWEQRKAEIAAAEARWKGIEARTVDAVDISDSLSESAHHLQQEASIDGYAEGRRWRASRNGWFSYDLKVLGDKPMTLVCTYRGSGGRRHSFDILVDGEKIATENLQYHPTESFNAEYPLPERLTHGKESVTVKFQARPEAIAGAVLDARIVQ